MKRICLNLKEMDISLVQTGKDKFIVRYGLQIQKGDYEYASRKLGEAIMHHLACEGKLDNSGQP